MLCTLQYDLVSCRILHFWNTLPHDVQSAPSLWRQLKTFLFPDILYKFLYYVFVDLATI